MKGKVLCFTGHRPDKLGGYAGPNAIHFQTRLHNYLVRVLIKAIHKDFKTFISGGALGVDQIAAEAVIELRKHTLYRKINLVIARPFPNQASKWPWHAQKRFSLIIEQADRIVDVSPDPYAPWKMQIRNEWMVNLSEVVIAVWNGVEKGGTWNCIQYAVKKQRDILIINPTTLEEKWLMKGEQPWLK